MILKIPGQRCIYIRSKVETEAKIDIMTFEEFVEGIVIHAEQNEETRSNLRWSEQGEAHINPIFSILMPCQYTYKYCKYE